MKEFSLRYRLSCIITIRRDFPEALSDLSGVDFNTLYGAIKVLHDVSNPPETDDEAAQEKVGGEKAEQE